MPANPKLLVRVTSSFPYVARGLPGVESAEGLLEGMFRTREVPGADIIAESRSGVAHDRPEVRILFYEFGPFPTAESGHVLPYET